MPRGQAVGQSPSAIEQPARLRAALSPPKPTQAMCTQVFFGRLCWLGTPADAQARDLDKLAKRSQPGERRGSAAALSGGGLQTWTAAPASVRRRCSSAASAAAGPA